MTRKQAANKALTSLGSRHGSGPVVVFGLKKALRPGAKVKQASRVLLKVRSERAFLFYEDSTPFSLYRHRGRVALVGTKSGRVRMAMVAAPLLAGSKLPVQVTGANAGGVYRVYYRVSGNLDTTSSATQTQTSTQSGA